MEYLDGGELFERVAADDFNLTESDCCLFMRQICRGVQYLHNHNIVHLDLKVKIYFKFSRKNISDYPQVQPKIFPLFYKYYPYLPSKYDRLTGYFHSKR